MRIVWYDEAVEDMDNIYCFYADKNEQPATHIFNQIIEESKRLATFPQIGSLEPLLAHESENYRYLVIRTYFKVIYFVDEINETVVIVRIWDCRQNPENLRID